MIGAFAEHKPIGFVRRTVAALSKCVVLSFALALPACSTDPSKGYSLNPTFSTEIQSVTVPMFGNTTYQHGLENELTSALITEIRKQTPWRVEGGPGAQTTLSGTIVGHDTRRLSVGRNTGIVEDMAVIVTIEFQLKDNRTGKVLVSRKNFTAAESFVPASKVGERLELGQQAAIQRLARDAVNELRSKW